MATPIIKSGKPLIVAGKPAMSLACCCGSGCVCPDFTCNVPWGGSFGISDCFELDTNCFDQFVFSGTSDDVAALVRCEDLVWIEYSDWANPEDPDPRYTITLPTHYILFRSDFGHMGTYGGYYDIVLTDGTNSYTWNREDNEFDNKTADAEPAIHSVAWGSVITKAQLLAAGLVGEDGIAHLRFAGAGDDGFVVVTGVTCS